MGPVHTMDGFLASDATCLISGSPAAAFVGGTFVELEAVSVDEGVMAKAVQPSVPCHLLRCMFPSWVLRFIHVGDCFTIRNFKLECVSGVPTVQSMTGDLLPVLHPQRDNCNIGEAFAGLGGWTFGLGLCNASVDMMVEVDPLTARACADTHKCPLLNVSEAMSLLKQDALPTPFVLQADIKEYAVWVIAGMLKIGWWVGSPPCPPWSSAATQPGLESPDGELFLHFLGALGFSRAFGALIENVPGLAKHEHYGVIKATIQECGMNLAVADVRPVMPVLPALRKRWLASCIRHDLHIDDDRLRMAVNMGMPPPDVCTIQPCSIAAARCVQFRLSDWEWEQCLPTDAAKELMSCFDYLPPKLKTLCSPSATPEQVMELRTRGIDQPLQPIMARQGRQHELPSKLLKQKGLYAYVLKVGDDIRFATPYEVATCLGFPASLILPSTIQDAWKMVGNSLCVMQAAWQYMRVWPLISQSVDIPCSIRSNRDLCNALETTRCQLQDFIVCKDGDWMMLCPKPLDTIPASLQMNDVVQDVVEITSDEEPEPKRQCISPTWEFDPMEEETEDITRIRCYEGHMGFVKLPKESAMSLAACVLDPPPHERAVPVRILHAQGVWVVGFFADGHPKVSEILQHVLPHAEASHFDNLWLNNHAACFTTRATVDFMSLVFQPVTFIRLVHASFLPHDISVAVDVAWKLQDLIAVVATKAGALATQVNVHHNHVALDRLSFVLAHDLLVFDCELAPQFAETWKSDDADQPLQAPVVPPVAAIPVQDEFRFTVVDPKWGTAKSVSVGRHVTVDEMLCKILPAYCCHDMPVVSWGDVTFYGECVVSDLPKTALEISFPSMGLPVGPLIHQSGNEWDGQGESMALNVKGPFEHRARMIRVPTTWTLLNLASHCIKDNNAKVTLLTLQGGRGIDPKLPVTMVDPNMTIEYRVCALPGGGKSHENVAAKLKKLLSSKGVDDASLPARAAMIMGKIPSNELAAIFAQEESSIWNSLKKKATECKLRLVTTQELHDFQRKQRSIKHESPGPSTRKPKVAKSSSTAGNQERVTIDLAHFSSEGATLSKLDISMWGPDRTGVTVATKEEAMKLLPVTNLAVQPLALVVLTNSNFAGVEPIAVPAIKADGQPTLASVAILNYGDIPVICKPNVPKLELNPTPTSILEIFIERALVTNWDDCQCPLTYLGHHLPEIRKQQVIASWSFAPYNGSRSKCKHASAEYWHGFVKIPEEHLNSTLTRSGLAGVFILVRSPDKKLDSSYGTVPLHGQQLEEVIRISRTMNEVLGVVQMGRKGPFALRARREHLAAIRLQAIPQGITLQEGAMTQEEDCGPCATSSKEPPATHLCLGSDYVAVAAMHRETKPSISTTILANQANLAGGAAVPAVSEASTVSTRLSDIKSDLEERLTMKLSSMMDSHMKDCDERITTLATTIDDVKTEVASAAATTQKQLEEQSATIQEQINGNNNNIIQQMKSLFSQMQSELQATLTPDGDSDPSKRKVARQN
eukprot:Skav225822  [mRNA]  locus=scaffold1814:60657:65260:+ [translate_table: standard]